MLGTGVRPTLNRRRLLAGAAATGAAAVTAAVATGGPGAAAAPPAATARSLVSADPLLHLLRRATYGPTPESIAEIRKLGAAAWLERQLNPAGIDDAACNAVLARLPFLALDIPASGRPPRRARLKTLS